MTGRGWSLAGIVLCLSLVAAPVAAQDAERGPNRLGFRFGYPNVESESSLGWVFGLSLDRPVASHFAIRGTGDGWLLMTDDVSELYAMSMGALAVLVLGDEEFRITGGGGTVWATFDIGGDMPVNSLEWVWEGTAEIGVGGGTTLVGGYRSGLPVDQYFIAFAMDL